MSRTKNLIVKILIGIPASGKSTWCEGFLIKNPDWVRVNRDDFRKMLRNEPVTEFKIENMITDISEMVILEALGNKRNVIVDNTHLKMEYIESVVKLVETIADVEFQVFDISLDKAIERDAARSKKVGEKVITRMYKEYKSLMDSYPLVNVKKISRLYSDPVHDPNLPDVVLFDIDGTLAHMNGKRGPFEWHRVDVDDLDKTVARIFKMHKKHGDTVYCVSGRDASCRQKTLEWLEFYDIVPDKLFMRPEQDFRPDNIIKKEIFHNNFDGKVNVIMVYDDRNKVVKMWRDELNLKCLQVNPGNF